MQVALSNVRMYIMSMPSHNHTPIPHSQRLHPSHWPCHAYSAHSAFSAQPLINPLPMPHSPRYGSSSKYVMRSTQSHAQPHPQRPHHHLRLFPRLPGIAHSFAAQAHPHAMLALHAHIGPPSHSQGRPRQPPEHRHPTAFQGTPTPTTGFAITPSHTNR